MEIKAIQAGVDKLEHRTLKVLGMKMVLKIEVRAGALVLEGEST